MNSKSQHVNLGPRWNIIDPQPKKGGNGHIYRAKDTLNELPFDLAIKVLSRINRYHRFKTEIMIASGLEHQYIVPILESNLPSDPTSSPPPYFVMPWCSNGTLSERLGTTQAQLLKWMRQIAAAIKYVHERNLAHRDIKPSNLLLDADQNLLLADFGLVFDIDDVDRNTLSHEVVGSVGYRAPELSGGRYNQVDHRPADIFSLGRTIWALATGQHPPISQDLNLPDFNLTNILGNEWLETQDLVRLTTSPNPMSRPTIDDLLNHLTDKSQDLDNVSNADAASVAALLTKIYANDSELLRRKIDNDAKRDLDNRIDQFKESLRNACLNDPTFQQLQATTNGNDNIQVSGMSSGDVHRFYVYFPLESLNIGVVFKLLPVYPDQFSLLTYVALDGNGDNAPKHPNSEIEFTSFLTETKKSEVLSLVSRQMQYLVEALENHARNKLGYPNNGYSNPTHTEL